MTTDVSLFFDDVSYAYEGKGATAVSHFSLAVEKGSFTTLLGPSGCGKTTLLRLVSGFLEPTEGKILLDGKDQKGMEPESREIGMVFQDYALFPHMTVRENILYGLKIHKKELGLDKKAMEEKVEETSANLDLGTLLDRYPHELSGGQQQRVALARALVLSPKVLLMDEPLSSLDTQLRVKVREELKSIQRKCGITTIYVTHDQEEALFLSDTIAVINQGHLLQKGSPEEIYYHPQDAFTAAFVGKANFLKKDNQRLLVRPEWFAVGEKGDLTGKLVAKSFLGDKTRLEVAYENEKILVDVPTLQAENLQEGMTLSLRILHGVTFA